MKVELEIGFGAAGRDERGATVMCVWGDVKGMDLN